MNLNLQQSEMRSVMAFNQEEPNEREKQIMMFCESQQEKLTRALNKTYKEGKSIGKIDET